MWYQVACPGACAHMSMCLCVCVYVQSVEMAKAAPAPWPLVGPLTGIFQSHNYAQPRIPPCRAQFRESQTRSNHRMGQLQKGTRHRSRVHFFHMEHMRQMHRERQSSVAQPVRKRPDRPPDQNERGRRKRRPPSRHTVTRWHTQALRAPPPSHERQEDHK